MKLNALAVKTAKLPQGKRELLLNDGNSLYLRVREHSKTWIIRRKFMGRVSVDTVGHYPDVSLKDARLVAAERAGQGGSSTTVKTLVEKYQAEVISKHKRPELTNGYINRAILPALGHRKVKDITRAELVHLIQTLCETRQTHRRPAQEHAAAISIVRWASMMTRLISMNATNSSALASSCAQAMPNAISCIFHRSCGTRREASRPDRRASAADAARVSLRSADQHQTAAPHPARLQIGRLAGHKLACVPVVTGRTMRTYIDHRREYANGQV